MTFVCFVFRTSSGSLLDNFEFLYSIHLKFCHLNSFCIDLRTIVLHAKSIYNFHKHWNINISTVEIWAFVILQNRIFIIRNYGTAKLYNHLIGLFLVNRQPLILNIAVWVINTWKGIYRLPRIWVLLLVYCFIIFIMLQILYLSLKSLLETLKDAFFLSLYNISKSRTVCCIDAARLNFACLMEENFASLSSDTWVGSLRNAYLWLDTVAFSVYILSEFLFFLSDLLYPPNYSWGIQQSKSNPIFFIKGFRTIFTFCPSCAWYR